MNSAGHLIAAVLVKDHAARMHLLDRHWRILVNEHHWHRCHPTGTQLPMREHAHNPWRELNAIMTLNGETPHGFEDMVYEQLRQASLIEPAAHFAVA